MDSLICSLKELKFDPGEGDQVMSFSGYGAVFGNVDAYGDVIEAGAFSKFLADVKSGAQPWPAMLSQHGGWQMSAEDMTPIGVWTDFAEDGHGLKVTGQLADTPRGLEMYKLMKMSPRPAIDGMSIGYIAKDWEPRTKPEDPRRRLKRIDLIEVSLVTRPANGKARVEAVKSIDAIETLADAERYLRDSGGLSKSAAVALVSRIKSLSRSDSGGLQELVEALKGREQHIPR
ncbi:HK97 family phage prohead protease [Xenophilus sp. Marseille-Q4582]|uniref:HK97 family phage prohead protease n=1 Tax=Xenophilus sp. Marseille-Q4582 TaxID=2866600 RepID=UPI001CE49DD2|nr:HK97 family phage prohead protease [Xenophilus sp. Marseille-Q4582]